MSKVWPGPLDWFITAPDHHLRLVLTAIGTTTEIINADGDFYNGIFFVCKLK